MADEPLDREASRPSLAESLDEERFLSFFFRYLTSFPPLMNRAAVALIKPSNSSPEPDIMGGGGGDPSDIEDSLEPKTTKPSAVKNDETVEDEQEERDILESEAQALKGWMNPATRAQAREPPMRWHHSIHLGSFASHLGHCTFYRLGSLAGSSCVCQNLELAWQQPPRFVDSTQKIQIWTLVSGNVPGNLP
jgi:hypothetical protein